MKDRPRKKLRIGITTGDVNGIGPELIITGLNDLKIRELFTPIVYGSPKVLNIYRKFLSVDKFTYNVIQHPNQAQPKKISVIDCQPTTDTVDIGKRSAVGGLAAFQSLSAATADLKAGELDAIVTMPIDKLSIQSKDFDFPGHTEYLTRELGAKESLMFMISETMKIGTVTGHVPISEVSKNLTYEKVLSKIKLMNKSLQEDFNIGKPTIAVMGLNPHAGDGGLLGKEDGEIILKAVKQAINDGILAFGPFSADGFFGRRQFTRFDGVLAMYHDQGLIPFKLMSGLEGINYTAGLPFIRTSPDHGVAYEIAGQNIANPDSFFQACFWAMDIYNNKFDNISMAEGKLGTFKEAISLVDEIVEDRE